MRIILIFFLITEVLFAQVPQGIPYQAIARNGQGQPLANLLVKVRFSVLDSTASGPVVYSETHEPITSTLGLFSVNVGMGNPSQGTFSGINWGMNAKFLKVELDTSASGLNYIDLGTQQMMSVPYALFARNAESASTIQTFKGGTCFDCPIQISSVSVAGVNHQQAISYCATLSQNGYDDWRLPSLDEIDYCRFELNLSVPIPDCWTKDIYSIGGSTNQFVTVYYISSNRTLGSSYYGVNWNVFCVR
jgi:hypothetical protein